MYQSEYIVLLSYLLSSPTYNMKRAFGDLDGGRLAFKSQFAVDDERAGKRQHIVRAGDLQPDWSAIPQFGMSAFQSGNALADAIDMSGLAPMGGAIDGASLTSSDAMMGEMSSIAGSVMTADSGGRRPAEQLSIARVPMARWREQAPFMKTIAQREGLPVFVHTYQGTDRAGTRSLMGILSLPYVNYAFIKALDGPNSHPAKFIEEWVRDYEADAAWPRENLLESLRPANGYDKALLLQDTNRALRLSFLRNAAIYSKPEGIMRNSAGVPEDASGAHRDSFTGAICVKGRHKMTNLWAYTAESISPGSKLYLVWKVEHFRISTAQQPVPRLWCKPHVIPPDRPIAFPRDMDAYIYIGYVSSASTEVIPQIEAVTDDGIFEFAPEKHPMLTSILTCNAISSDDLRATTMRNVQLGNANANSPYFVKEAEERDVETMLLAISDLGLIEVLVDLGQVTMTQRAKALPPCLNEAELKAYTAPGWMQPSMGTMTSAPLSTMPMAKQHKSTKFSREIKDFKDVADAAYVRLTDALLANKKELANNGKPTHSLDGLRWIMTVNAIGTWVFATYGQSPRAGLYEAVLHEAVGFVENEVLPLLDQHKDVLTALYDNRSQGASQYESKYDAPGQPATQPAPQRKQQQQQAAPKQKPPTAGKQPQSRSAPGPEFKMDTSQGQRVAAEIAQMNKQGEQDQTSASSEVSRGSAGGTDTAAGRRSTTAPRGGNVARSSDVSDIPDGLTPEEEKAAAGRGKRSGGGNVHARSS
jgi:hypothetical protein